MGLTKAQKADVAEIVANVLRGVQEETTSKAVTKKADEKPVVSTVFENDSITVEWCPAGAEYINTTTGETQRFKSKPGLFKVAIEGSNKDFWLRFGEAKSISDAGPAIAKFTANLFPTR